MDSDADGPSTLVRRRRPRFGGGPAEAQRSRNRRPRHLPRTLRLPRGRSLEAQRDPRTHVTTTLIRVGEPRGIDVAGDGSLFLVEATAKRVGHYGATGAHLGDAGPVFNDPYDVEVGADGTVFVLETAASGTIKRIAPDGSVSTLSSG